jgi:hypothetical protein
LVNELNGIRMHCFWMHFVLQTCMILGSMFSFCVHSQWYTGSFFFSWWINFRDYFVFIESQWYWLLMFFLESLILYDLTFLFVFNRITMELTFFFLDDLISVFASLLQCHIGILVFITFLYDLTFVSVLLLSNYNGIGSYCVCFCSYRIMQWYISSGCFSWLSNVVFVFLL